MGKIGMGADVDIDTCSDSSVESDHALLRHLLYTDWLGQMHATGSGGISTASLLALWSRYKFVVLAYDQRIYRQIGPLLADLSGDVQARAEQVLEKIMEALAKPPSRQHHVLALEHVAGFVSKFVDAADKRLWLAALADYQAGRVEFSSAATVLQGHLQQYGGDYVRAQQYPRWFLQYPSCEQQTEFAR